MYKHRVLRNSMRMRTTSRTSGPPPRSKTHLLSISDPAAVAGPPPLLLRHIRTPNALICNCSFLYQPPAQFFPRPRQLKVNTLPTSPRAQRKFTKLPHRSIKCRNAIPPMLLRRILLFLLALLQFPLFPPTRLHLSIRRHTLSRCGRGSTHRAGFMYPVGVVKNYRLV